MNSSSKPPHFFQIDLLKGLAIIAVLILHIAPIQYLVPVPTTSHYLAWEVAAPSVATRTLILLLWGQAIPIFLVVMGVTSGLSFIKRGYVSFKDCYSRDYFSRRFWRFYVPYLVFQIPAIFVGLYDQAWVHYKLSLIPRVLLGVSEGAGAYFIAVLFQFVLIFPLLFYIYKKSPSLLLVACFATTFVFELLYSYSHTIDPVLYQRCVLRFLPEIGLGLCIAGDFELLSGATRFSELGKKAYLYVSCAVIGFILIFLGRLREYTLIRGPWTQAFLLLHDPFWPLWSTGLVILGMHYLPKGIHNLPKGIHNLPKSARDRFLLSLALVGVASYHIFLAQMLYFPLFWKFQVDRLLLWSPQAHSTATLSLVVGLASISACIILGILFMYGTNKLERTLRHRS